MENWQNNTCLLIFKKKNIYHSLKAKKTNVSIFFLQDCEIYKHFTKKKHLFTLLVLGDVISILMCNWTFKPSISSLCNYMYKHTHRHTHTYEICLTNSINTNLRTIKLNLLYQFYLVDDIWLELNDDKMHRAW